MKDQAPVKTPLQFALDSIATPEARDLVVKMTHAVISTCMTQAMLRTKGKTTTMLAAEARCYAAQLHELEKILGSGFSNVIPHQQRVVRTTPSQMPNTTT